jgi:hypothetical protein
MWEEIKIWLEEYSGVDYDLSFYLTQLKGDNIFLAPLPWRDTLSILLEKVSEMIDVIDEKWTEIPEELPPRQEMKQMVTSEYMYAIIEIINDIKQKLNIEPTDIRTFKTLEKHVDGLCDLIQALAENSMETLIEKDWFEEYEDNNHDFLSDTFGISKSDLSNMHFTVNDIINLHKDDED